MVLSWDTWCEQVGLPPLPPCQKSPLLEAESHLQVPEQLGTCSLLLPPLSGISPKFCCKQTVPGVSWQHLGTRRNFCF